MNQTFLLISISIILTSTSSLASNLPVAYEVIELGALETANGEQPKSLGYDLNNNGHAVGISLGKHTVETEVDDGVTLIEDINVNQPVHYNDLSRKIMPEGRGLGFGKNTARLLATTINDDNLIAGYGLKVEELSVFNKPDADSSTCTESETKAKVDRLLSFFIDSGNSLKIIPNFTRPGLPLDPYIAEFTTTRVLSSNRQFLVGDTQRIIEKDDCNNISRTSDRGFIYDIQNQSISLLTTLEPASSDQFNQSFSCIRSINERGDYVGYSAISADARQQSCFAMNSEYNVNVHESKGILGNTDTNELTEVNALEEATWVSLNSINDLSTIVVGASNSKTNLSAITAFYTSLETGVATPIGFLKEELKFSQAFDINDDNLIVGSAQVTSGPSTYAPFIYDIDAERPQPINLNELVDCNSGWKIADARKINNDGTIIGTGIKMNETGFPTTRAILLTPKSSPANQSCEKPKRRSGGSLFWLITVLLTIGYARIKLKSQS
ncbi:DUF3466 family protein [Pleionea sediminis]|uniref:DUF3466 family protein n=1 Tax=Pleionea sediminis TaxID=2569479 RepID=UPI0011854FB0|nr:DUF3466 family protein [Pleionea sediminis]